MGHLGSPKSISVVVTGGCGVLGSDLCHALHEQGYKVVSIDKRTPGQEAASGITYVEADIRDVSAIESHFRGATIVVHTAALHGYHLGLHSEDGFFANNVLGLFSVLEAAVRHGVEKVVFTSSTSVYNVSSLPKCGQPAWINESFTTNVHRLDVYDKSKIIGEKLCADYASKGAFDAVVLRPTRFFFDDFVSYHTRKLFRGVDLRDVVQAHTLAVMNTSLRGYEIFNVAARTPWTPADGEELYFDAPPVIERYFPGTNDLYRAKGWELPTSIDRVYDTSKAEQMLGFRSKFDFRWFVGTLTPERAER